MKPLAPAAETLCLIPKDALVESAQTVVWGIFAEHANWLASLTAGIVVRKKSEKTNQPISWPNPSFFVRQPLF